jgi:hypothetical protein
MCSAVPYTCLRTVVTCRYDHRHMIVQAHGIISKIAYNSSIVDSANSAGHVQYLTGAAVPIGKRVTPHHRETVSTSITIPITTVMVHDV